MEIYKNNNDLMFEKHIRYGFENIDKFKDVFCSEKLRFVWDIDGILIDTPKSVLDLANKKYNFIKPANPWETDEFDFLTKLGRISGFNDKVLESMEADWYKSFPMYKASPYEGIPEALEMAIDRAGPENNFVLTSRKPKLERATNLLIAREFPRIPCKNILIRKNLNLSGKEFKMKGLKSLSDFDGVTILLDDVDEYIKAATEIHLDNLYMIAVPVGKLPITVEDPHLLVLERYPLESQGMLPLKNMLQRYFNSNR